MSFSRRTFIRLASGSVALTAYNPLVSLGKHSGSAPEVDSVSVLEVPGSFNRPVAMNAYDDAPKGKAGTIRMVQLSLSDGTTGLGVEGYSSIDEQTVAGVRENLIGINPLDVYRWDGDRISGLASEYRAIIQNPRYAWFETPLLDAIGKLKEKPVHALFGPSVRDGVPVYDGTLYFKDVELNQGPEVIGELASRIKSDGYKAIKMKVGRPYKWMKGEAGVQRDIEAVAAAREAVGSNFNLMADANNGYQDHFDWAMRFLKATEPYELYWMEEIFPEKMSRYKRLLREMHQSGFSVPIAEGESVSEIGKFRPYLKAGIFEVIQPDMRTVGFSNILRASKLAASYGKALVPHNWQSEMGKIMSIHAAKVRENIRFAEDDRWSNHAFDTSGYLFRDGQWWAPESPGWGVSLNENYERFKEASEELVI